LDNRFYYRCAFCRCWSGVQNGHKEGSRKNKIEEVKIMQIMTTTTYPTKSVIDIGKIFVESMAKPMNHVNLVGMWVSYAGEGITAWAVHEMEKGHEDEGLKELTAYFVPFLSIDGYKVNILPVAKPEDALALIGITPPS